LIVNDTWGFALMAGLILKEVPFLFLMVLAALPQTDADRSLVVARTLGYGAVAAGLKVVLPRLYPQIRLPILAVLAYGVSVVDVSLVLGPTTPSTLPVQILKWINDPDLTLRFRASAAALLQLGLVAVAIAIWLAAERYVAGHATPWLENGTRTFAERGAKKAAQILSMLMAFILAASLLAIVLWSVAEAWRFPEALPRAFTLSNWMNERARALTLLGNALVIALAATALSLVLVIACLEREVRLGATEPGRWALWLLYLPLLVPQIAFLLGLQVLLIVVRLDETLPALVLAHMVFVLPYVFLSLADPWRAFDERFRTVALTLGASPLRSLLTVRLPMLLRALLTAAAVGIAVSIGQFLATQLVAGARWPTITTEAVALSSGGNRRTLAIYALLQMLIPLCAFLLATLLPALIFRSRRGMGSA
jgi:putative thiamine transport system permease protein